MLRKVVLGSLVLLAVSGCAHRHGGHGDPATPEQRKMMADKHQQMADCLRSEKAFSECKKDMMADCKGGNCLLKQGK